MTTRLASRKKRLLQNQRLNFDSLFSPFARMLSSIANFMCFNGKGSTLNVVYDRVSFTFRLTIFEVRWFALDRKTCGYYRLPILVALNWTIRNIDVSTLKSVQRTHRGAHLKRAIWKPQLIIMLWSMREREKVWERVA